jgi:hypothetical protein
MRASGGQVYSSEILIAFLIFMVSFTLLIGLWDSSTTDILRTEGMKTMETVGIDAAEVLVRTPGIPSNWSSNDVLALGLINESRVLSAAKIGNFTHYMSTTDNDLCPSSPSNYDCNLYMLGIAGYDFYFNISYLNGSTAIAGGAPASVGRRPSNETMMLTVTRTALLDGDVTRLYLTVWRNSSWTS